MASPAQTQANRENSKKSTGPVTSDGLEISVLNSTKHGLLSSRHFAIMADEDRAEFQKLVKQLNQVHQPRDRGESDLIFRMAQHEWLRARAIRYQNYCLRPGRHVLHPEKFALYLRYQTSNERSYSKCLKELLTLKARTKSAEIGFVSQNRAAAAEQRAAELHILRKQLLECKVARAQQSENEKKQRYEPLNPQTTPQPGAAASPGGAAMAA